MHAYTLAHLSDAVLLRDLAALVAPHLTPESADELIEAGTHRRKSEIEEFLARRFPPAEVPARVRAVLPIPPWSVPQLAPGQVGSEPSEGAGTCNDPLAPGQVEAARAEAAPASPERFLLQLTIGKSTHEKLRYAQALLSHALPTGDVAQVLDRALDTLIAQLERRKLGAAGPRPGRHRTTVRKRHVPSHVRRAVWERDQGQCTFVSARGHRCKALRFLEFDHVDPVARGGRATVEGMRLRCRAHNQYEAERTFGAEFMSRKRHEARLAAAGARARAVAKEQAQDVFAGLRGLGCRADEARRAAEFSEALHGATPEERMRAALKFLGRRLIQRPTPAEMFHGRS